MALGLSLGLDKNKYNQSYLLDGEENIVTIFSDTKLTRHTNKWIDVRRSSDNAEQTINYVNGVADTTTLLSFCAGTNGYISKRYNQVAGADDLTVADTSKQQQIVNAGVLVSLTDQRILYEPANSSLSTHDNLLCINGRMDNLDNSSYIVIKDNNSLTLGYNADYVYPIKCSTGLMDFSLTAGDNIFWYLADGTTSTSSRPAKSMSAGVSYMFASNLQDNDIRIFDQGTNTNYVGDLSDLFKLNFYLNFTSCSNMTGNISSISQITFNVSLASCTQVIGDISSFNNITYYLNLGNCSNLSGILTPQSILGYIYLHNTAMSANDTDQTLINLAAVTAVSGGTLYIKNNRTAASNAAYTYLAVTKSWSITEV